ncbi:L,D-transpeptidase family protein [Fictibacillus gelatini]|uniref:L,D-transpeptidase family protein n=1 Tax=Fictibacillus gelatini TaxID=225985 RepID=UPI0004029170|nr:L,D-transpeptidase family protein [Fictibacillus gelatini]
MRNFMALVVMLILIIGIIVPIVKASGKPAVEKRLLEKVRKDKKATQAIIVTAKSETGFHASLVAYEYRSGKWEKVYSMPAVIGKKGITFDMHEGGMKSPAGIYFIDRSFGTAAKPSGMKLPYQQTTEHDYWVDDVTSKDYNQWKVYKGDPHKKWKSFERLHIPLYKYAAVIRYNEDPIVKGKGSAIFFHIWPGPNSPTAGCTAVSEENIVKLLKWMDPEKKPVIIQGTADQLTTLSK